MPIKMRNIKTLKDVYVYGFVDHNGETFAVCYPNEFFTKANFGYSVEFECKASELCPI